MGDDLTIVANRAQVSGWQSVRLTRGIERCPSDFEVEATERYPGAEDILLQPGDEIVVKLGSDRVLTGYIDEVSRSISKSSAEVTIRGRSKCCDLIDCSAEWSGGQINGNTVLSIAQKLAKPYGITVSGSTAAPHIPQCFLNQGETAFDIIERYCRSAALLCYDDVNGNLVLSAVGTAKHSSGIIEGKNVEAASFSYSMHDRFSVYKGFFLAVDLKTDVVGTYAPQTLNDPGIKRHRLHTIIAETGDDGSILPLRLKWEANRRAGRAYSLKVVVDNWRDSAGRLWTPNMLVAIDLPALKVGHVEWIIAEASYTLDGNGSHAALTLMPPAALSVQPFTPPLSFRGVE